MVAMMMLGGSIHDLKSKLNRKIDDHKLQINQLNFKYNQELEELTKQRNLAINEKNKLAKDLKNFCLNLNSAVNLMSDEIRKKQQKLEFSILEFQNKIKTLDNKIFKPYKQA